MLEKLYSAATRSAHVVGLLLSTSLTLACQEGTTDPGGNGGGGGVVVPPGYFVSPSGAAGGNGTIESPWDLPTVLGMGAGLAGTNLMTVPDGIGGTVQATVVWVRSGTYGTGGTVYTEPTLQGTSTNPVILRAYPGERAILDFPIRTVNAPHLWFWGLESTNSSSDLSNTSVTGLDLRAPGNRVIHCIVHNHLVNGIGWWNNVTGHSELYGNLIYNNGRKTGGDPYAHGIYTQNQDPATKKAKHNVIFHNFDFNIHQFGGGGGQGYSWVENVMIGYSGKGVGGIGWVFKATPVGDLLIDGMMGYSGSPSTVPEALGQVGADAGEFAARVTFINGYMRALGYTISRWQDVTFQGNTWLNRGTPTAVENDTGANPAWTWNGNAYYRATSEAESFRFFDAAGNNTLNFADWKTLTGYDATSTLTVNDDGHPTTNKVFVLASEYEPKGDAIATQGLVVIFNWENLTSVSTDISSILNVDDQYGVYHVFDRFGTPVASGNYEGGTITIPMTAVEPPVPTTGWPTGTAPSTPGPEFGAFIVVKQ